QRIDIADIARHEQRCGARRILELTGQRLTRILVDVDECDVRALPYEVLDDRGADAGPAAGDEHDAVAQAGIGCIIFGSHGNFPVVRCSGSGWLFVAAAWNAPRASQTRLPGRELAGSNGYSK